MFFKTTKRVIIAVIGSTVVLFGIALIVLPGPAILVIPAGLAILATEFAWAKRLLKRMREEASSLMDRARGSRSAEKSPDPVTKS